jgi:oxygen-independent coproporphyrinogen-3 oxidase
VHVPFCAHKCQYCAFYSEPPAGNLVERYISALSRELELVCADLTPRTVYFGGGTPSLLSLRQWERIFQAMDRLRILGAEEWTVECNPATISLDQAKLWRDYGVNRVSLGIQSLDQELLQRLGRIHTRVMAFRAYDCLRCAGCENVNLDLMFAIPGQSLAAWRQTLIEIIAMNSEHLSCYEVTFEEDTPLFDQLQAGQHDVDEDLADAMYEQLVSAASGAGLCQYEISNFARHNASSLPVDQVPDRACQHNVNYWRGGAYYGVGPSAASYVRRVRLKNWADTRRYCELLEQGQAAVESRDELTPLARAGEIAAFGLRMTAGWSFEEFRQTTGFDLRQEWAQEIQQIIQLGYGQGNEYRFRLTPRGLRFADWVAEQFIRIGR